MLQRLRWKGDPYFQQGSLYLVPIIAILWHAASRIWNSAWPEFRLWWVKFCSCDNYYSEKSEHINSCYRVSEICLVILIWCKHFNFNFSVTDWKIKNNCLCCCCCCSCHCWLVIVSYNLNCKDCIHKSKNFHNFFSGISNFPWVFCIYSNRF